MSFSVGDPLLQYHVQVHDLKGQVAQDVSPYNANLLPV